MTQGRDMMFVLYDLRDTLIVTEKFRANNSWVKSLVRSKYDLNTKKMKTGFSASKLTKLRNNLGMVVLGYVMQKNIENTF